MSEYNEYVNSINKIFELLSKMREGYQNQDNLNYIESIEEYRDIIIDNAKIFQDNSSIEQKNLEALGND